MRGLRFRGLAGGLLAVTVLCTAGGCTGDLSTITFLDVLNTVFLGITAAGGIVLIRNI